jgi:4-amino-4-deoxy-L-arabinose transferase-like glycosyltransferase
VNDASGTPRGVMVAVAAGTAARLALAALVPITVDEAYYAQWAAHLQPGYLDHPPLVAWLMRAGLLLGHGVLAARLPAIALLAATTLLAASLVRARAGDRAAVAAAVLLQAAPVFSLGGALTTPDAPLALAWVGALWSIDRAERRGARWLAAAGLFLGLGALSKLTAGLLAVAIAAALLSTPRGRALLRTRWALAGAAIALAVASPVIAWNAARGFPSLAFQAEHGMRGRSFSPARLAGSVGAQAGYVSPVLLAAAAVAASRALRAGDPAVRALAWSALPVVVFFTAAAAFTPGALPHWPAPGWLSAALLLAIAGAPWLRAAAGSGLALSAAGALAVALAARLGAPGGLDPLGELRGWREGARAAVAASGGARLAVAHWIALGQIGWYADAPVAYVGARPSAPSFYEPDPRTGGEPLLVVVPEGLGPSRPELEARLGPLQDAGGVAVPLGGGAVRRFTFLRFTPPLARPIRQVATPP